MSYSSKNRDRYQTSRARFAPSRMILLRCPDRFWRSRSGSLGVFSLFWLSSWFTGYDLSSVVGDWSKRFRFGTSDRAKFDVLGWGLRFWEIVAFGGDAPSGCASG